MDDRKVEDGRPIESVRAAIYKYGGKINTTTNPLRRTLKATPISEERPSKASELHLAKKKIDQFNEGTTMAESEKSQAQLQLLKVKKLAMELTSQIQESQSNAKDLNKTKPVGERNHQYEQVSSEVEALKHELSKLKLDMARAMEEKSRAEKEAQAASSRLESYMSSAEQLRREIDEANEEEVLVLLAEIQARKELAEIEAQRKEEREKFMSQIEETQKKMNDLRADIEGIKEIEERLAETNSDVEVLKNELNLIREMDKRVAKKNAELQTAIPEELEDVKKELSSVHGGAFQLMTSMDLIRIELKEVVEEKQRMQKFEEETETSMKKLNLELLRARDMLEEFRASEEKEIPALSSLSLAVENLEREKRLALKESEDAKEEISSIRTQIQKIKTETSVTEEILSVAMQELTEIKSAEAKALKKLKSIAEKAAKTRASASRKKSNISVSRFEYDYLTECAAVAQEVAEKKIEAAHAWAEALRDSETEMKMEIEWAEKEIKHLRLQEEEEIKRMEKSLDAKDAVEEELQNQRKQGKRSFQGRRSMRENGYVLNPARQPRFRRSVGSPTARRVTTSASFTMKRRRKMMLKIDKYFASKQVVNKKGVSLEERD